MWGHVYQSLDEVVKASNTVISLIVLHFCNKGKLNTLPGGLGFTTFNLGKI